MTITSRRLARRCRERLAMNSVLPCPASAPEEDAHATVEGTEPLTEVQQEKVDATK
jgi:hypothetical protein